MTEFFDVVYEDRRCTAPTDIQRGFYHTEVQSLDAPKLMPAGSTRANKDFHSTSVVYRH